MLYRTSLYGTRSPQDLHLLPSRPAHAFNAYLMGGVLVDAGTRGTLAGDPAQALDGARARPRTRSRTPTPTTRARAPRSATSSASSSGAPDGDADAMESGDLARPRPVEPVITRWQLRYWAGPAHPVARRLREGDQVGGFTVLETPGPQPGPRLVLAREPTARWSPATCCSAGIR